MNNFRGPNKQKGVVIIVALFIMALIATMAYTMMARLQRDTERTSMLLRSAHAEMYAHGSIAWAIDQLKNNYNYRKPQQMVDDVPIISPDNDLNGYIIKSSIYDMQARFNLNNLSDVKAATDFTRLLRTLVPDLKENSAEEITRGVMDWISPVNQQNEFSQYYLQQVPPYNSSHRLMRSASELKLVKGMTAKIYRAIEPYITALPTVTPVNVQTALAPVLSSLSSNLNLETGLNIESLRKKTPFVSEEVFFNLDIIKNHPIAKEKVTTISKYFLVETEVRIERQRLILYTLLERAVNNNKSVINILWQSKNVAA